MLDFRQTDIEKKEDQITRLESECAKLERDLRRGCTHVMWDGLGRCCEAGADALVPVVR